MYIKWDHCKMTTSKTMEWWNWVCNSKELTGPAPKGIRKESYNLSNRSRRTLRLTLRQSKTNIQVNSRFSWIDSPNDRRCSIRNISSWLSFADRSTVIHAPQWGRCLHSIWKITAKACWKACQSHYFFLIQWRRRSQGELGGHQEAMFLVVSTKNKGPNHSDLRRITGN